MPEPLAPVAVQPLGATVHEAPAGSRAGSLSAADLASAVREAALGLGFARIGFCPVEPFDAAGRALASWLEAGRHGEMAYMAGASRSDPKQLLPEARTLVVVALPYGSDAAAARSARSLPLAGVVARYARGIDYHDLLKRRLRALADACARLSGRTVLARACVDTAPLLEREAARRAGVGFTAKNTLTIVPGLGSYVLLGELLLDLELMPAGPVSPGCGSCRICLDACPTGAFVDAYTLDARRCISYLTIELQGSIPRELRPLMGRWVFGCDVCQEVCPHNRSRRPRPRDHELCGAGELDSIDLVELLQITSSSYRRLVRGRALRRVSRARLQRNAAVALGNAGDPAAVTPLALALARQPSSLVRAHAAWALGRIGGDAARAALLEALSHEGETSVREEIEHALAHAGASSGAAR